MASYKGITINSGSDADVAAQMAAIDSKASGSTNTPTKTNTSTTDPAQDPILSSIQNKLLKQSDLISSSNTGIEDKINEAITGVKTGTSLTDKSITSSYNRQISDANDAGANAITAAREGGAGFATSVVALRNLVQTTDKNINDLEQRKQELILQNDAAGAGKIADLQIQGLQFKQAAMQQTFSNLLGMGQFGLSIQQRQDQEEQFNKSFGLQQDQAMSSIALQYGLTVQPGETLQSLYSRATKDMGANSPAALAIKQAQASISASYAQTAQAYQSMKDNAPLTSADLEALGTEYLSNPQAVLGAVKNTSQLGQILQSAGVKAKSNIDIAINQDMTAGISKNDAIAKVTSNANLSPDQQAYALKQINVTYQNAPKPKSTDPFTSISNFARGFMGERPLTY